MSIKQGDSGAEVGELQQQLIEAGYTIARDEEIAQAFGSATLQAVEDFQARHVDLLHRPLAVDGVVGPSTAWALKNPGGSAASNAFTAPGWRASLADEPPAVRQVMATAIAEIGMREDPDGSNSGPRVNLYQAPDGPGLAWCAAFVCWCWSRRSEGIPFERSLRVWDLYRSFKAAGRLLPAGARPQPGDIFLILRSGEHGHCGLVASVAPDGTMICTVEGNASNAVRGLIRPVASINAFARPVGEVPPC